MTEVTVYEALSEHQQSPENWEFGDLFTELHRWAEIFNVQFKLEILEWTLCVERLRRTRLGQFRYGNNGFGLRGEIALNSAYLTEREGWQILGTLLHELLHAWQQAHGVPGKWNYHNKQFREKARTLGLIIDERGCTRYESDSPFTRLLLKYGVAVPEMPSLVSEPRRPGTSKLKRYTCGCTNARVATRFAARCLLCGNEFERADS